KTYLHLDLGEGWTSLDLWSQGALVSSRTIPDAQPHQKSARLATECRETAERSGLAPTALEAVLITGATSAPDTAPLLEPLHQALGVAPRVLASETLSSLAVQGALDIPSDQTVNLLPESVQKDRENASTRQEWV